MIRSDGAGGRDELRTPFVERRTYRRRRLMDIARIAPLVGALLFMVPLLWPRQDLYPAPDVPSGTPMSSALIYIFAVWIGLVVFAVGFSYAVRRWAVHWTGLDASAEVAEVLLEPLPETPDTPPASVAAARDEEQA